MRTSRRTRRAGNGAILLFAALAATPSVSHAQAAPIQVSWFLRGLQGGVCINFLVSPATAADEVRRGSPIPAESLADEYPALAREVRTDPPYAGWVPAEYCWFLYDSALVAGRVTRVDGGKQPVLVGYVAIRASGLQDSAQAYATQIFTNAGPLLELAGKARMRVDKVKFSKGTIPELENVPDRFRLVAQHGGTIIQWDGGPGTPAPPTPVEIRLAGLEVTNSIHTLSATFQPDSAFTPSGDLRILGTGDLQELISASPIRYLRSFVRGGDSDWILNW